MRVVGGEGDGRVSEEAVVEEGGFEDEVREGGEEMPDVEDAELAGGVCGKEVEGGEVGG